MSNQHGRHTTRIGWYNTDGIKVDFLFNKPLFDFRQRRKFGNSINKNNTFLANSEFINIKTVPKQQLSPFHPFPNFISRPAGANPAPKSRRTPPLTAPKRDNWESNESVRHPAFPGPNFIYMEFLPSVPNSVPEFPGFIY